MTQDKSKPEVKEIDPLKAKLKFSPLKDILLFVFAILLIAVISLITIYNRPSTENAHVEIRYNGSTLLFDKNDPSKSTSITFPSQGEKRVEFRKEDSSLFLKEGETFAFEGDSVTFTLYSDKSFELKWDDVTCKDHRCSKEGRIYYANLPIVCLPNKIQAQIVSGLPEWDA